MLAGKRIVLGVTGGIAAYKTAELVRLLVKQGAVVQVVMTEAARQFITPLTLEALSGRPVACDMFQLGEGSSIDHVRIADEADLLLIAPATAHVIARLAHGLADDLLTTLALVTRAPLLLAPAMNVNMWRHQQTQANLDKLIEHGAALVGPAAGSLACGWVGAGRMSEPNDILEACSHLLAPRDLEGQTLLVTAGPTHEPIDPVRYLGNRSSGKMGFAIARRAAARGARVTLVAGPVALPTPAGVERIDVVSAEEMLRAVLEHEAGAHCIVKAAAVADFRPVQRANEKIKRGSSARLTLELEANPDILATLVERRRARGGEKPLLVGFAAETQALEENARAKLEAKGCDLLVANDVSRPESGFDSDDNQVVLLTPGQVPGRLPLLSKDAVADRVLDWCRERLAGQTPAPVR